MTAVKTTICVHPDCTTAVITAGVDRCHVHRRANTLVRPSWWSVPVPDWTGAACAEADPELFHAADDERPAGRDIRERAAKRVCAGCPIKQTCLDYGRRVEASGIWGGQRMHERSRRPLERVGISTLSPIESGAARGTSPNVRPGPDLNPVASPTGLRGSP